MGERMKKRRKLLHLTQEQMAEKLNISVKHYGGVERGNAGLSIDNLIEISRILGLSLDYLVKGEADPEGIIPDRMKEIYRNGSLKKRRHMMELLEAADKL